MKASIDELAQKARRLSPGERELLAERLLTDLHDSPLNEVDEAWVIEAEKRFSLWKAGKTKAVDARKAVSEIRKELRK